MQFTTALLGLISASSLALAQSSSTLPLYLQTAHTTFETSVAPTQTAQAGTWKFWDNDFELKFSKYSGFGNGKEASFSFDVSGPASGAYPAFESHCERSDDKLTEKVKCSKPDAKNVEVTVKYLFLNDEQDGVPNRFEVFVRYGGMFQGLFNAKAAASLWSQENFTVKPQKTPFWF